MICVVYASEANPNVGEEDVAQILEHAESRNGRLGITGALVFDGQRFCQLLEGEADAVTSVMERILRDKRHADIEVLSKGPAAERRFPGWAMLRVERKEFETMLKALSS